MAFKRLPNGFGTVTKLSGNRRKPYRAMKRIGIDESKKPIYKTIGYYEKKSDAIRALSDIQAAGDVMDSPLFHEVYKMWKKEYEMKKPMPRYYIAAYNHMTLLHYRKIKDIRTADIEYVINETDMARTVRHTSSVVLHGIYGYAMRHEFVQKDYSQLANYNLDMKARIDRKLFTSEEIHALWKSKGFYNRCILVLLYTGMRISELADIRRENVHLEDRYMMGGLKTDAGRNRIIPIHEKIVPLIKKQLKISRDSDHVFVSENGTRISQQNLIVHMKRSGMEHTPHDTRHTFSSQAYVCGMDENILKRILGHALNGVTQQVYIHLPVEELVKAVNVCDYK